jgi:hypothetical protein
VLVSGENASVITHDRRKGIWVRAELSDYFAGAAAIEQGNGRSARRLFE